MVSHFPKRPWDNAVASGFFLVMKQIRKLVSGFPASLCVSRRI